MRIFSTFVLSLLLLQSCSFDDYVAEPFDPRLPAYTEGGKNDAGAYVDGVPWRSATVFYPFFGGTAGIRLEYTADDTSGLPVETRLSFTNGRLTGDSLSTPIEPVFHLRGIRITNGRELKELEGRTFNFGTPDADAELLVDVHRYDTDTLVSQKGTLYIRYVQYSPDDESVIVAGTFGFETMPEDSLVRMTSGRFDYWLGPGQFYPM